MPINTMGTTYQVGLSPIKPPTQEDTFTGIAVAVYVAKSSATAHPMNMLPPAARTMLLALQRCGEM